MGYVAWRPEVKGVEHVVDVEDGGAWSSTFEAKVDGRTVDRRGHIAAIPPWNWGVPDVSATG